MRRKFWMTLAVSWVLALLALAAEEAKPAGDITKPGTYTSGKWSYTLETKSAGYKTESRTGVLSYDGQALKLDAGLNDWVRTPWGPLYWVGKRLFTWGDNGWMPKPAAEKRQGRELAIPGLAPEETAQLPTAAPAAGGLLVGKEANGTFGEVDAGQTGTINLPGNPTTGYEWSAQPPDDPAVSALGPGEYQADPTGEGLVGSGGQYFFRFRAERPGAAKITLSYRRSWEKNASEIFTVLVRVLAAKGR